MCLWPSEETDMYTQKHNRTIGEVENESLLWVYIWKIRTIRVKLVKYILGDIKLIFFLKNSPIASQYKASAV